MTPLDPRQIETASLSDIGRQRSSNQDAYGSLVAPSGARLLIVADGMGGHAGGATASRLAVAAVQRVFETSSEPPDALLRTALEVANREVYAEAQRDAELAGMGTTGVALLIPPEGSAWVGHVGDSRAYLLRDGRLQQLTDDHSLVAELQRRGMLTPEEALAHPRRNEVLRSIGVEPEVSVDVLSVEVSPGDQYLLCSDGLSGVVSDEEIAAVLQSQPPGAAARSLVDRANARGGPDNITVQIARIPEARRAGANRQRRERRSGRRTRVSRLTILLLVVSGLLAVALAWGLLGELGLPS